MGKLAFTRTQEKNCKHNSANSQAKTRIVSIFENNVIDPQWLNSKEILEHEGGDLPFEVDISKELKKAQRDAHRLTVAVNNTLLFTSQGRRDRDRR